LPDMQIGGDHQDTQECYHNGTPRKLLVA
jgi:hypothetical protein